MKNNKRGVVLKLAIIGGGISSAIGYTHLIASQMDHRFEVVAACFSRESEKNRATVLAWNLHALRIYNDWLNLLNSEAGKIDAVVVLTPTPTHHDIVIKALELNHSVICEKSLASSYTEGLNIYQALERKKGFLAITYNYTGYPMLRELKEQINAGHLGKITHIHLEMPQEGFAILDKQNNKPIPQVWRLQDGEIPSISLDLDAHLHHMIHFISNENPKTIIADQSSFGWFKNIIDNVTAIAHYPSGMKSVIWYGKSTLGYRNGLRIRVFGTQGSAEWHQMEPEILVMHDSHGNRHWLDRAGNAIVANLPRYNRFKSGHSAGFIEAFSNLYVDIADKLEEYLSTGYYDNNWTYGVKQALVGLKIMSCEKQSNLEQGWVQI